MYNNNDDMKVSNINILISKNINFNNNTFKNESNCSKRESNNMK